MFHYRQLPIVPLLMVMSAAALAAAPSVLVTDEPGSNKEVEINTIEPGPPALTAAELEKLIDLIEQVELGPPLAPLPAPVKGRELSTIVIGPPGLSPLEQAKLAGTTPHEFQESKSHAPASSQAPKICDKEVAP